MGNDFLHKGKVLGVMSAGLIVLDDKTGDAHYEMTRGDFEAPFSADDGVIKALCTKCGFILEFNQEQLNDFNRAHHWGIISKNNYLKLDGCLSCGKRARNCTLEKMHD